MSNQLQLFDEVIYSFKKRKINWGENLPDLNMDYVNYINYILSAPSIFKYKAIDLFAGCGGLSLGFEAAGIKTIGYEIDDDCVTTYNNNLKGRCHKEYINTDSIFENADFIIGGPPCQPFSVIGRQDGHLDSRNGFPSFVSAIERYKPKVWMFENVRGVYYRNKEYVEQVLNQLQSLGYIVEYKIVNAVRHGVPQNRERFIAVGHKSKYSFPKENDYTVNVSAAITDTASNYDEKSKILTPSQDNYISVYESKSHCIKPRDLYLDAPARTLTCRNLAGATSDMHRVRLPDGRRRRITTQEAKRLQSFPDWFIISGNETNIFNQIGNAVPPLLALYLANSLIEAYEIPELSAEHINNYVKSRRIYL